jgi:O-antigen/teichoic acid export membrane protein
MKAPFLNLLINYAHTFFLVINGLFLVPVYLSYFPLSTYGSYLAAANLSGVLGLTEIGLSLVLTRKLTVLNQNSAKEDFSYAFGAGVLISATTLFVICLISVFSMRFVPKIVNASDEIKVSMSWAFLLTSVGIALNANTNALNSVLQSMMKIGVPGIINLLAACAGIATTIISLKFGAGVVAIALGVFVKGFLSASSIAMVVGLCCYRGECLFPAFSMVSYRAIVRDCFPVFMESVSKAVVDNCQILLAASLIDPISAAIYAITNKSYHVCTIVLAPIGSSLFSTLARWSSNTDANLLKSRLFDIFHLFSIFSGLIISVSFSLNEDFISLWVGDEKYGGNCLSLVMCLAAFFTSRCTYLKLNLMAIGAFGKTVALDQILAVVRLLIIVLFIKSIGIFVIPLAELITSSILSVGVLWKVLGGYFQSEALESSAAQKSAIYPFALLVLISFFALQILPITKSWLGFSIRVAVTLSAFVFILLLQRRTRWSFSRLKLFSN